MKILITADTHYRAGSDVATGVEKCFYDAKAKFGFVDMLVIAGDIAESIQNFENHRLFFRFAKKVFPESEICFCAGNHDIWMIENDDGSRVDSLQILTEVLPDIAKSEGVNFLEGENIFEHKGFTLVGTLGFYDYSLAKPDLSLFGEKVTEKHYRAKIPPKGSAPTWNDVFIEWDFADDKVACEFILQNFEKGLKKAVLRGLPILSISHCVPFSCANAWASLDTGWREFYNAFAGSKKLGEIHLANNKSGLIKYQVSGHTHRLARCKKAGIKFVNIGSTYGRLNFLLLEFVDNDFKEIVFHIDPRD